MKIAICDDEAQYRQEIADLLKAVGSEDTVKAYASGMALWQSLAEGERYDLIFMDIEMSDGEEGLRTAADIYRQDKDAMLVFVTSHANYNNAAFQVEAMDFLVKPLQKERFWQTYQRCLDKYERFNRRVALENKRETRVFWVDDILYLSSERNYLTVYLRGGETFVVRMSMSKAKEFLISLGFTVIHKSYLINLAHTIAIAENTKVTGGDLPLFAELRDGEREIKLPVSRNNFKRAKEKLNKWRMGAEYGTN